MTHRNQFLIRNDLPRSLTLNIEPEGAFFPLGQGEEVRVTDVFSSAPVTVKLTVFVPRSVQVKFVFDKLNPKVPEQLSVEPLFTAAAVVVAAPDEFK